MKVFISLKSAVAMAHELLLSLLLPIHLIVHLLSTISSVLKKIKSTSWQVNAAIVRKAQVKCGLVMFLPIA